jgi:hypothetical protein
LLIHRHSQTYLAQLLVRLAQIIYNIRHTRLISEMLPEQLKIPRSIGPLTAVKMLSPKFQGSKIGNLARFSTEHP